MSRTVSERVIAPVAIGCDRARDDARGGRNLRRQRRAGHEGVPGRLRDHRRRGRGRLRPGRAAGTAARGGRRDGVDAVDPRPAHRAGVLVGADADPRRRWRPARLGRPRRRSGPRDVPGRDRDRRARARRLSRDLRLRRDPLGRADGSAAGLPRSRPAAPRLRIEASTISIGCSAGSGLPARRSAVATWTRQPGFALA